LAHYSLCMPARPDAAPRPQRRDDQRSPSPGSHRPTPDPPLGSTASATPVQPRTERRVRGRCVKSTKDTFKREKALERYFQATGITLQPICRTKTDDAETSDRFCKFFKAGRCWHGLKCGFRHGPATPYDKARAAAWIPCKHFNANLCEYGDKCGFHHGPDDHRHYPRPFFGAPVSATSSAPCQMDTSRLAAPPTAHGDGCAPPRPSIPLPPAPGTLHKKLVIKNTFLDIDEAPLEVDRVIPRAKSCDACYSNSDGHRQ
jgi:hypothetical protein